MIQSTIETADVFFQIAIEASPTGILVVDRSGTILFVNHELERQFGYARAELVGKVVDLLVPEALRPAHVAHREGFVGAPESRPMGAGRQLIGCRKDGSHIPVEIGLHPVRTPDGPIVVTSVVDITARLQSQAKERAAIEERLAFKGFVTEASSRFINLPAAQIDEAIRNTLAQVCAQLGLDRSAFYRLGPEGRLLAAITWTVPDVSQDDALSSAKTPLPGVIGRVLRGEIVSLSTLSEIPTESDRRAYQAVGTRSMVVIPLSVEGKVAGAVSFATVRTERTWPPHVLHRLEVIASVFNQVLARQQRDEALQRATAEAQRLKDLLQVENVQLRRAVRERLGSTRIVGQSVGVRRVLDQIEQVAATHSTVLLLGETGTGKELFATHIHELGPRSGRAMVTVNCAAIPATLIESELFGREKGAFTGALSHQVGRFELAHRSTLFLDEIGDLPPDVQVKLLRALEEGQIERLGSPRPIAVDVRIIAATHRNLEQRISERTFREDLYYRLNVFPIHIPPLRERQEDIPGLVWRFVEEFSRSFGKRIDGIDRDSLSALQAHSWPGNIRELRNVVERAMIAVTGTRLTIPAPQASAAAARCSPKIVDVERKHIRAVLDSTAWRIRGKDGAAERLGLKPTTLETRMAKLGLRRPGLSGR